LGQKRKCPGSRGTSVLPLAADIVSLPRHVRLVPTRDSKSFLFDHLVGECEQLVWNGEAQRLRSLEVDDQLELGRLLHRHIGRLFSLEYATDIYSYQTIKVGGVGPVTYQAAGCGILAPCRNGRDGIPGGQSCDLPALVEIVPIGPNHNRAGT